MALLFVAAEIAARWAGVLDFPLFRADPQAGYIQKPNQAGAFLNRHRWAYNDHGLLGSEPFHPAGVLIVGDSVANGGNPIDQDDKIAPRLQHQLGVPAWSLASGGWALENELQALKADPELLKAPTIVFISNSGDFGALNPWASPLNYPLKRPPSALLFAAQKTMFPPHDVVDSPASRRATTRWRADLADFLASYHGRLIWVLYPQKTELTTPTRAFADLRQIIAKKAEIVDLSASPEWRARGAYRDGIHPTPAADAVIADAIARQIRRRGRPN